MLGIQNDLIRVSHIENPVRADSDTIMRILSIPLRSFHMKLGMGQKNRADIRSHVGKYW